MPSLFMQLFGHLLPHRETEHCKCSLHLLLVTIRGQCKRKSYFRFHGLLISRDHHVDSTVSLRCIQPVVQHKGFIVQFTRMCVSIQPACSQNWSNWNVLKFIKHLKVISDLSEKLQVLLSGKRIRLVKSPYVAIHPVLGNMPF